MEADELLVPKITNKGISDLAVFWISRGGGGAKHANACNVLSDRMPSWLPPARSVTVTHTVGIKGAPSSYATSLAIS
jgi:hypothetical protein